MVGLSSKASVAVRHIPFLQQQQQQQWLSLIQAIRLVTTHPKNRPGKASPSVRTKVFAFTICFMQHALVAQGGCNNLLSLPKPM